MRDFRNGILTQALSRGARKLVTPTLLAASVAVPFGAALQAKDKPGKAAKEVVAKKVDDSTRIGGESADKHVLSPALEAARTSRETVRQMPGYSTTFIKQEETKRGLIRQVLKVKYRREPFSIYLKFVEPHEGREVLFVEGKNKGKLQVHEPSGLASLAGTLSLSPTGDEAMKENRYPVTMFGMEKLMDAVIAQWEEELKHPESEVKQFPQAKVGEFECRMFEVVHPRERSHFKFHKTRLFIDKKSGLPVRLEQYGFPGKGSDVAPLVEEYTYTEIKVETKLSELDFDIKNQSYGFK
jgi:hypothetical protein